MVEKFLVPMSAFHRDRMIRVFLPEDYQQTDVRYPVLYMHDGQNVFDDEEAYGGISLGLEEYLNRTGSQVIVVAIDRHADDEERKHELCPWVTGEYAVKILGEPSTAGGKGEAYADFVVQELKPLIDSKYRTLEQETYMAGVSLGGLIATYAACRYPGVIKRVAGISSGFYRNQEKIEDLLEASDLSHVERFYLDVGTKEAGEEEEVNAEVIASIRSVYDIVQGKVENTEFEIAENGRHQYRYFRDRVPGIFSFLLEG